MVKDNFLKNLNQYMVGKRQKDLADFVGVSKVAVSHWMKGNTLPRLEQLDKIGEFLDIPPYKLLI